MKYEVSLTIVCSRSIRFLAIAIIDKRSGPEIDLKIILKYNQHLWKIYLKSKLALWDRISIFGKGKESFN